MGAVCIVFATSIRAKTPQKLKSVCVYIYIYIHINTAIHYQEFNWRDYFSKIKF